MILINASSQKTVLIFQSFYPIHPPVGVGLLIAYAEREGIKVQQIDQQIDEDVLGKVAQYVRDMEPPYIFGFSVLTSAFKAALEIAQELKRIYPESFIVFGGIHPTVMPDEVLAYKFIDVVIRGDGEKPLVELYRRLKSGKDFSHIENLSHIRDGKTHHNPFGPLEKSLDKLPPFPYHLYTHERYDLGFILSSRGCPYDCTFCSCITFPGSQLYRYLSNDLIVDQLETLHKQFHQKSVLFVDDNFLVNKKRIYNLIEKIQLRGLANKINLTFQARGDGIDRPLLKAMREVGFNYVLFGLETSSETVMENIKKGETVQENIDGVKIVKELGYSAAATFIFGLPGETHEDRMRCIEIHKETGLDVSRYNCSIPYPGTELFEQAKKENRLTVQGLYENFSTVTALAEHPFKKYIPLPYVPPGNTELQIKRDVLLASFLTYVNIPQVIKILGLGAHSSQGAKWINVGNNFFAFVKNIPGLAFLSFLMSVKFAKLLYWLLIKKETRLGPVYLAKLLGRYFMRSGVQPSTMTPVKVNAK